MWKARDPDDREVVLTAERWAHVLDRHPYIDVTPAAIMGAVARPDERTPGHEPNEEWFYRRGAGPSSWIRIVVHFEHGSGLVVTAFPRRSFP